MKRFNTVNKALHLPILIAVLIGCESKQQTTSRVEELPYYEEATFTPKWFDSPAQLPTDFHQVPAFALVNQLGDTITEKDMAGKIYVIDFFFTTCPGICPKLTGNMALVQEAFLEDDQVLLLSHSVTPDYDSVAVLKEYADVKGVVEGKWHLLTGDRDQIYNLGRNAYFVEEDLGLEKDPDDFIHTENLVLVDGSRHIRGIYNGLNKAAISQLMADIKTLIKSKIL
ncbi:SCO family protein [uncultured Imperialibacter sp.]|uniref:SCO family protein n=1 Tax=uncultured Imperialibacter sp. TaxID=1672639 RepID=UPI0030D9E707|tara:strand:+ start:643 stop:1320 length:678 start_codon:yes stop_codon:yes gene_type:complete